MAKHASIRSMLVATDSVCLGAASAMFGRRRRLAGLAVHPGPGGTMASYVVGVDSDWAAAGAGGAFTDPGAQMDARLEELLATASGPVNWRAVASGEAELRWSALREWVEWFRLEFGFDHRVVPPCWYRHRALVNVLSALRDHWLSGYDPMNAASGASEWHRVLNQLEPRLRDWAARTGCTASAHRPDLVAEYPDDREAWDEHVTGDIAERERRELADALATAEDRLDARPLTPGGPA